MLVYFHGLNSSAQSHKVGVLRRRLSHVAVFAPDYPAHRPRQAVQRLSAFLRDLMSRRAGESLIAIGSSIGGFYAQHLAQRFAFDHLFMINPALRPSRLLAGHLGASFATARGERYLVSKAMLDALNSYQLEEPCMHAGPPTTLFLDTGDEVIDYREAAELYRSCGRVLIYAGGDHAFQHLDDAIGVIADTMGLDLVSPDEASRKLP